MNWTEFFYMGGYAFEVWLSWGLTVATLIVFVVWPKIKHRQILNTVHRQVLRERRSDHNDKTHST